MTHAGVILALPRMYATLQFSFRLESYVLMGISGALLAALVPIGEGGGRRLLLWRWLLVPIAIVSIVGALEQVGAYTPGSSRDTALRLLPPTPRFEQEGLLDYVDDDLPIVRRSCHASTSRRAPPTAAMPASSSTSDTGAASTPTSGRGRASFRSAARGSSAPTPRPTTCSKSTRPATRRGGRPHAISSPPRQARASSSGPPRACP